MTKTEAAQAHLVGQGMDAEMAAWTVAQPDCAVEELAAAGGWQRPAPLPIPPMGEGPTAPYHNPPVSGPISWRRER